MRSVNRNIVDICAKSVKRAGADGGGVSVFSRAGSLVALHATDRVSANIEHLQFTLGEGPCMEAAASRSPVLVSDLADMDTGGTRWPAFHAEATAIGVSAIFAFPVHVGSVALATLDLYRCAPGSLSRRQLDATHGTVDELRRRLLDMDRPSLGNEHDHYAMTVHQAAGMIMAQLDCGIDEALLRLRSTAYAEEVRVDDLAAEVVSRRRRFGEDPA
jgi:hypothetical protein